MRDKTGRGIRVVMLAVVSASCVALLAGCDPDEEDPADVPSASVVSEGPSEDPFGDTPEDPDDTANPRSTGADPQSIAPPPPPPTDTSTDDEDTPTSAPSPSLTQPPEKPSPKAPAPVPPDLPDPDGT